jgi:hypothetical protein
MYRKPAQNGSLMEKSTIFHPITGTIAQYRVLLERERSASSQARSSHNSPDPFWRIPKLELSREKHSSGTEVTGVSQPCHSRTLIRSPRWELLLRYAP